MKIIHSFNKKLWLAIMFGGGLIGMVQPAHTEERTPGETSRTMEGGGTAGSERTSGGVTTTGGGRSSPTFQEADKNGDHYVTKDELQGYPELLKRFDTVDAGKTGRLEEHEYGNLVMEKSREKGR
jgi:hypothetical protein